MVNLQTSTYVDYKDAYNDIVTQVLGSAVLTPNQKADCLEALKTIAPYPTPTGSANYTPVTGGGDGGISPILAAPNGLYNLA